MKRSMLSLVAMAMVMVMVVPAFGAGSGEFTVVASFYPVYLFTLNVVSGLDGIRAVNLTPPTTGCLHDYQLTTEDMRTLSEADALVINGAGMETWLDQIREQYEDLPVIDGSEGIALLPSVHGEDGINPHIWLDPRNAAAMSLTIGRELSALLPDRAAELQANAEAFARALRSLDEVVRTGLVALKRRDIVTFHEAFPYFAEAYGLNVIAVVAIEPDEALSPKMLSDLVERIQKAGTPPLFTEPQYSDAAVRAIVTETGAQVYELDPLVTGDGDPRGYEEGTIRNMETLLLALGGE